MLKRKITAGMLDWKQDPAHKVLLLLGARQVGKTYAVRHFAQQHYKTFVEINFIEDEENGSFLSSAKNAQDLISRLSLIIGHAIEPGTLVFFDEVQHLGHHIVTLSKFLMEDGRFDLILSGSLLGAALEGLASFPVGYARIMRMFPLDFEEFCWALGVPDGILAQIREHYHAREPLEPTLHDRMIEIFRRYIVIGGMPEAVQGFIDSGQELGSARSIDTDIVEQYRYDIIKYASSKKMPILTIFDNIPSQLAKVNKRFELASAGQGATYRRLQDDFAWLTKAGVALPAELVSEPKRPLLRTCVKNKFKLYSSDCGLLLSQYPQQSAMDVISGSGDANFGAVYENVVAQELAAAGFPLYYYNSNRKGEVDFLIEDTRGRIIPIEVKSGKDYKLHSALNNLLGSEEYDIPFAYVLSEHNVSVKEKAGAPVFYLPLYMSMCLSSERDDAFQGIRLEPVRFDASDKK